MSEEKTNLFLANYQIGGEKPGAPLFIVHFMVNPFQRTLTGHGLITTTTHPREEVPTKLDGQFFDLQISEAFQFLIITANGVNKSGVHNVDLFMNLRDGWKAGEGSRADYKYMDDKGEWKVIYGAPVILIPSDVPVKA